MITHLFCNGSFVAYGEKFGERVEKNEKIL